MKKNHKPINWEKVGVYIAVVTLIVMFASKINDLGERIAKLEGKFEVIQQEGKTP